MTDAKVPSPPLPGGLTESEALQQVAGALGIGLSIIDRDFRIVWTNHLVQPRADGDEGAHDLVGMPCYRAYYGRGSICPGCLPLKSFQDGQVYTEVSRRVGRDGQPRYLQITSIPVEAPDGTIGQVMEIAMNVTSTKLLEEQLAQAQKLALVGQMAAGLAHEIKNPLAGMKGALGVLRREHDRIPPAERAEVLQEVDRQLDRLNRNVEDLLAFARPPRPQMTEADLNDVVGAVLRTVRGDPATTGVSLRTELGPEASGRFDPNLLEQALLNLAQNAVQALGGRGSLTIRTRRDADLLSLEVEDDGPGMSPEVRRRALDPFFTTKTRGTGLGLPIVQRIADAHGGHVLVRSRAGEGTRVRLLLPQD